MTNIQLLQIEKSLVGDGIITTMLESINLTFEQNEFTTIVGASGSGKSTLPPGYSMDAVSPT